MADVHEINDIAALAEYRAAWSRLLDQTRWATFFLSLEWLEIHWRHFGQGQKLRVLVVGDASAPAGILPLVVRREQSRVGSVRTLTYPLHDWGSFYGPIGPDPAATLEAGLAHVERTRRDWDVLDLRWSGAAASDLEETGPAMRRCGLQGCTTVWARTAVIDLPDTWEQYLADRSHKWRHNYRRWERRLADAGAATYERHRPAGTAAGDDDPRWDIYDTCEELARRSWQGNSASGTTLCHDSVRPFLREVHAAAARAGAVDMNLMRLDGRPLAFIYNYCWRGAVYGLRTGYDADVSREGPGNVLYFRAIRDSIERGDRFYDMGAGSLDIKRHFLTRILPIRRYGHYPLSAPRTQILRVKRWIEARAERNAATAV